MSEQEKAKKKLSEVRSRLAKKETVVLKASRCVAKAEEAYLSAVRTRVVEEMRTPLWERFTGRSMFGGGGSLVYRQEDRYWETELVGVGGDS